MDQHLDVWAMMATPFKGPGADVDVDSLRRYCRTVVARGCTGLVMLGVIGEPATLTLQEKVTVVGTALMAVDVPVHAGVMSADPRVRHEEAAALEAALGDALAGYLVPVTTPDPLQLRDELRQFCDRFGKPVVVQDYPAFSGVHMPVDALALALAGSPGVLAVKCEAQPTAERIRELGRRLPGVRMMSGLGGTALIDDLDRGASLVACGISRPEAIVAATRRWQSGDVAAARELIESLRPLLDFELQRHISIGIRKEHWRRQGVLESAAVRAPTLPYPPSPARCPCTSQGVDWMQ